MMLQLSRIKSFVSDFHKELATRSAMDSNDSLDVNWGAPPTQPKTQQTSTPVTPQDIGQGFFSTNTPPVNPPPPAPPVNPPPPAPPVNPPPSAQPVNPPPSAPPATAPSLAVTTPITPGITQNHGIAQQALTTDPSNTDLIDIADENAGESAIGRFFYTASTGKAFLIGALLFSVIPLLLTFILAFFGEVISSKDTNALPLSEDYASLSFFALGILLPFLVLRMMNTIPLTIESLSKVLELDTDRADSKMSKSRLNQLVNTYSYLYCKETGRNLDGITLPTDSDLLKFIKNLDLVKKLVIISCVGYSILTAYNRFTGVGDALVWHNYDASVIAYISRTLTDFLLAGIMGPLVLYPIILSVMITYHSLKQVADTNSLKFIRFSKDEAGGLGEYGIQSFLNTIALLPYSVVLVGIIIQARSLEITLPITTIAATAVYLALLLFVFFFPLTGAAKSMAALKKKELESISEHYANSYSNFKKALEGSEDLDLIRLHSEAMIAAETVFDGVMKQPTVPYSKALIARLAASVAPVFGTIASLIAF